MFLNKLLLISLKPLRKTCEGAYVIGIFTKNELLHQVFFKDLAEIMIYLSFFAYFLGTSFSRNNSYLVAASESIASNILKSDSHFPKKNCFICFSESPLKVMKNAFYFTFLKTLFVLRIFIFLS